MKNANKLTEGALFLAIFSVLLLMTVYLPVIGAVVSLFLPLPFLIYAARNDRKSSFIFFIGAIMIGFIVGTVMSIPLTLQFGLTGLVLGDFVREKKARMASLLAGTLVFLLTLVGQYAVSVLLFEVDVIKQLFQLFEESMQQSITILQSLGQSVDNKVLEQLQEVLQMMKVIIPSAFVISSFLNVFLIQLISYPIVERFGISIPKKRPFREFTLPKSVIWYYLAVLIGIIFLHPEQGTYWYSALYNVSFVLQILIIGQGLSLIYFFAYEKQLPKFVPIILTVFLPFIVSIVRILGIIDLGFNLKKWILLSKK